MSALQTDNNQYINLGPLSTQNKTQERSIATKTINYDSFECCKKWNRNTRKKCRSCCNYKIVSMSRSRSSSTNSTSHSNATMTKTGDFNEIKAQRARQSSLPSVHKNRTTKWLQKSKLNFAINRINGELAGPADWQLIQTWNMPE